MSRFARRAPDIVEGLVIHGVGPEVTTDEDPVPFAFCHPAKPPKGARGNFRWLEELSDFADRSRDAINPVAVETEVGDYDFLLRNSDRVAELFRSADRSVEWRLESDWSKTSTTIPLTGVPSQYVGEVHHLDRGESIQFLQSGDNPSVVRGARGTEPLPHPERATGYREIPYWHGRTCEVVYWIRGRGGPEPWWYGFLPMQDVGTDATSTVVELGARGQLVAFLESKIPNLKGRFPAVKWGMSTGMPKDPGRHGSGDGSKYLWCKNYRDRPKKTGLAGRSVADQIFLDGEGRIWPMAAVRDDAPQGAAKRHPESSKPIDSDTYEIELQQILVFGDYFDIPSDSNNPRFGLASGKPLEGHAIAPIVSLLRSYQGFRTTKNTGSGSTFPTYDLFAEPLAKQAHQIFRDQDVTEAESFGASWPEFTVDHFLVGHTEETMADFIRRALRPFGIAMGVAADGRLNFFFETLPRVDGERQQVQAHHPEEPKIDQTFGGLGVREHTIEYGRPTDADGWRGSSIKARVRNGPTGAETFVDRPTDAIDANCLAPTRENIDFLKSRAVERVATAELDAMVIRVPLSDGPFGLGDKIEITSLGTSDNVIVRERSRADVTPGSPLFAEIIGKLPVPGEAAIELEVLYRENLVRLRAHGGWIVNNNSGGDDDTITLHPDPQWGNDIANDVELFQVGDQITIYTRAFQRQGGPYEVAATDVTNRTITISGTFGLGDLYHNVVRVADYDDFSNTNRENKFGSDNPWTYMGDSNETVGASDDPGHTWG